MQSVGGELVPSSTGLIKLAVLARTWLRRRTPRFRLTMWWDLSDFYFLLLILYIFFFFTFFVMGLRDYCNEWVEFISQVMMKMRSITFLLLWLRWLLLLWPLSCLSSSISESTEYILLISSKITYVHWTSHGVGFKFHMTNTSPRQIQSPLLAPR